MTTSYKDTMILPETDFPMRGNLPETEPARLEWWNTIDIYHKVLEKNQGGEPFILHDGPPYANGPIHIGHAFNKILKDFVNKTHAQRGYFTPYIPGWDCHGQPIEHEVEKTLGTSKMNEMSQDEIRQLCREWAEKFVDVQREGFKRLGVNGDWDRPYLTFTPSYEAGNVEVFKKMYLDGAVYRGRKPIHWCSHCHTALAEAEIEYGPETSPAIYVRFAMTTTPSGLKAWAGKLDVGIWTTTPWTLPADEAVILHPEATYVAIDHDGRALVVAKELAEPCCEKFGWKLSFVDDAHGNMWEAKGIDLKNNRYQHPIFGNDGAEGVFIYADYVTLDDGTGIVHSAPGHGVDDYKAGMKFDIPVTMPVDDDGRFYTGNGAGSGGPWGGMSVTESNPHIVKWLEDQGTLILHEDIEHSYPHCWRCHEPVIFRATDQWFVSMETTGLRDAALDQIRNKVNFIPSWGVNRIGAMVEERPDWCISRQRNWGVPIPVFKCRDCGEVVANEDTFDAVIDLFNREGADAWFVREPSDYLPEGVACPKCGGTDFAPDENILDVWWESGVSHVDVLRHRAEEDHTHWPAEMYLEGSDQHRGWFQSSLLCGVGAYGAAPYKNVMCCGFTVDEEGRKMSKSLGNGIDPSDVIAQYGADVLRLWVASSDYSVDVSIGDEILKYTSDAYRKFRNTFRYLLGALNDFDDQQHAVKDFDQLEPFDQWALCRLATLLDDVNTGYDSYQYHKVFRAIYDYVAGDLSAVYLDAIKDRLYAEAPESQPRRSAQTVLMNILEVLVRVLVPILSFTTEEVWQAYPLLIRKQQDRPESVQLAGWPDHTDFVPALPADTHELEQRFSTVMLVRNEVTKAIEDARSNNVVKKNVEAALDLTCPPDTADVLRSFSDEQLNEMFIVSKVNLTEGDLACTVAHTNEEKCPRCWTHRALGGNANHPAVCERCGNVLDAIGFMEE